MEKRPMQEPSWGWIIASIAIVLFFLGVLISTSGAAQSDPYHTVSPSERIADFEISDRGGD